MTFAVQKLNPIQTTPAVVFGGGGFNVSYVVFVWLAFNAVCAIWRNVGHQVHTHSHTPT